MSTCKGTHCAGCGSRGGAGVLILGIMLLVAVCAKPVRTAGHEAWRILSLTVETVVAVLAVSVALAAVVGFAVLAIRVRRALRGRRMPLIRTRTVTAQLVDRAPAAIDPPQPQLLRQEAPSEVHTA
jgi:hypothetical protein